MHSLLCSPCPAVPPGLSMRRCGATGSASCPTACPIRSTIRHLSGSVCQCPHCCESSLPPLPVSAPHSGLDECFFFISLVVGLPCSLIFCQFWLFFVFKLLLTFWLCQEVQCVYLRLHLGQKPLFPFLEILFSFCCSSRVFFASL